MLLVDDGKLALDKPVTTYLPDFKMSDERYKDITVRMLLNHTSGIPGTEFANSFGFQYNSDLFKQTLDSLSRATLKHNPGAMAVYCNDGFTLAEMIIERVSGKKFVDILSVRVFKPLGMKNTGLSVGEVKGKTAASYYNAPDSKKEPLEVVSLIGAGGLSSTAEDLCRFADTFSGKGKQIFSASSLTELRKVQPSLFTGKLRGAEITFGLGLDVTDIQKYKDKNIQIIGKNGGTGNYSSMLASAPAQRLSVAVIASGPNSQATKTALDILDAVLVGKGVIAKEDAIVSKPLVHEAIPQGLSRFAGYYADGSQVVKMNFDMKRNTVTANDIGEKGELIPKYSLYYNNGKFFSDSGTEYYFTNVDGNDYFVLTWSVLGVDTISLQKLSNIEKPQNLKIDMNQKVWLRRNTKPYEGMSSVSGDISTSRTIGALRGYVDFGGLKAVKSPTFAGVSTASSRDQNELTLIDKGTEYWALATDMLFSPVADAGVLEVGTSTVKISDTGYSEWLKADDNLILSFEKPEKARVIVFTPDYKVSYDSAVDKGKVSAPKGSFVEFAGMPGEVIKVVAK